MLEDLPLVLKLVCHPGMTNSTAGITIGTNFIQLIHCIYTDTLSVGISSSEFNENEINSVIIYSHVVSKCMFSFLPWNAKGEILKKCTQYFINQYLYVCEK